jgi:hypothetical protein
MIPSAAIDPLVDVVVYAFNQERFIEQAVGSVLQQETSFPFRIIVLEDFSTDNTRSILLRLAAANPDRIDLRCSSVNMCSNDRFMDLVAASGAKYLAHLDGDDYWTAPDKLQRQVDFMEAHPQCAMSFHRVRVLHEDDPERVQFKPQQRAMFSTFEELCLYNFIATCSSMYRIQTIRNIPAWYVDVPASDWHLHLLSASSGPIGYMDDCMGVYRVHSAGLWSRLGAVEQWQQCAEIQEGMLVHFGADRHEAILRGLERTYRHLALACANRGDVSAASLAHAKVRELSTSPAPLPVVARVEPPAGVATASRGGEAMLHVRGDHFSLGSYVLLDMTPATTSWKSSGHLLASFSLDLAGPHRISVVSEAGESNSVDFRLSE